MTAAASALRPSGRTKADIVGCSRKMTGNTRTLGESIVMNVRTRGPRRIGPRQGGAACAGDGQVHNGRKRHAMRQDL